MKCVSLSICIPSYNRVDKAILTTLEILQQRTKFNFKIIVLDNGSLLSYKDIFLENPTLCKAVELGYLQIIRNTNNIGMSANFLRLFELSDSNWMWLLSDDDKIHSNAVSNIYKDLENCDKDIGFIKYSSGRTCINDNFLINNVEEFIDYNSNSIDNFNGFLFISNGVYKLSQFKSLIVYGYQYSNTFIPHFMMLFYFFLKGGRGLVSKKNIVTYVVPEIGYSYGFLAGLSVGTPKNIIADLSPNYYMKLMRVFFPHNDFKVLVDLYFHCKSEGNLFVYSFLVTEYVHNVSVARSSSRIALLRAVIFLTKSPFIFELLIKIISKFSQNLKAQFNEIKKRY